MQDTWLDKFLASAKELAQKLLKLAGAFFKFAGALLKFAWGMVPDAAKNWMKDQWNRYKEARAGKWQDGLAELKQTKQQGLNYLKDTRLFRSVAGLGQSMTPPGRMEGAGSPPLTPSSPLSRVPTPEMKPRPPAALPKPLGAPAFDSGVSPVMPVTGAPEFNDQPQKRDRGERRDGVLPPGAGPATVAGVQQGAHPTNPVANNPNPPDALKRPQSRSGIHRPDQQNGLEHRHTHPARTQGRSRSPSRG
jgi:hypothetical protein